MEFSKPHLLLSTLLLLLLLHPQLTSSACVQREHLHLIHALLPQSSSSSQQQPRPQPTPADQQQQPTPTAGPAQAAAGLDSSSSTLDTALAGPASNQQTSPTPAGNAAIKDICSKTDYPDICITSLTDQPIEGNTLDAAAALQMLIKAAIRHGNAALADAKRLASDASLPDFTLQNMKVCEDTYTSALDDFQKASDAAVSRDMGTLNTMLSAAMTDYETCSDGFMEMPGASPLVDHDDKLSHMASNCLAVASLLK